MGVYHLAAADADDLARAGEQLHALYRRCFAEPPWAETEEQVAKQPERFVQHLAEPGAHGLLAALGGVVVGSIYGWPTAPGRPDTPFYERIFGGVEPTARPLLGPPALEVVELMVDPAHRGHGLGRDLLARFITGYPRAWLCTHAEAPARRLYDASGWSVVGSFTSTAGAPQVVYLSCTFG
ncbi:GNAT superfamily N-acetyltransferase [Actinokineospora baliensis]|uniref:GNAT family N-acetyltransferase n=1 Tax=Actinokineospora baliensis TaxID=547056 RepID=UPI0019591EDA|nr:GNAT family N-acetyltransferase [Actinokineospora baliensis]MBM7775543.1 GNAT superfamily N-acetyltransferase [Actinokineospora baliensis]